MDQSMVMPMAEADSIFVRYRNKDSDISQVFKKIKCLKCESFFKIIGLCLSDGSVADENQR